ncbi:MAG: SMI1/KNR4 family protein [Lachnospiraceae bacterium]|nr:SMI1/KNR4 family protein [Lachnospiraceae bacterium]
MLIAKFADGNMESRIAEFEKEYHITLPSQYREFLLTYNGGYTPKTKFKAGKESSDIRGFYGVGDVKLSFDSLEIGEWTKQGYLPIAVDSFGNYIAIGLNIFKNGKIYFCDHEKGYKAKCIVKDFRDFINICESEEIDESFRLSVEEREAALIARGRGDIITDALRQMWQEEIDKYKDMIQEEVVI